MATENRWAKLNSTGFGLLLASPRYRVSSLVFDW
jgi:hypothetical protein